VPIGHVRSGNRAINNLPVTRDCQGTNYGYWVPHRSWRADRVGDMINQILKGNQAFRVPSRMDEPAKPFNKAKRHSIESLLTDRYITVGHKACGDTDKIAHLNRNHRR